jgi:hypothetical protein
MLSRSLPRFQGIQAGQRRAFVSATLLSTVRYEGKTKADLVELLRSRGLATCVRLCCHMLSVTDVH